MTVGALRVRLTLEEPQLSDDGGGGSTVTWVAVTTLWGGLRVLSSRERAGTGGRISQVTHDVTIRHRGNVGPHMRLTYDGRVFSILAVLDDERRNRLVCHCREEVRA